MNRIISIPTSYKNEFVQTGRVFPLVDLKLETLISDVLNQKLNYADHNFLDDGTRVIGVKEDLTRNLFNTFKDLFQTKLENSKLNSITNLATASRVDICLGCTQFIDTLYMQGSVQVLENEYNYHGRLTPDIQFKTIETLTPGVPLIVSQPFYNGSTYERMDELLNKCLDLSIPVHIDGAWITACKNINLDFSHPAIRSVAISMSKGYGLSGWNRIGLRWIKDPAVDAITIMNDFLQVPAQSVAVGIYFLNNIDIDHLWNTHSDRYYKICNDFGYTPTDTIHAVCEDDKIRGIAPLIRYLESISGN
ncbi:hypothetical protein UFOVP181_170 [uncultured Caudovirales phage]|uniref:Uncharacterized protein n=1 Tax=uncultured Caudovirales phage TaxID=2100421 RepID=A0A6J7WH02_9CAUD|nr:hypothetical protein UFOVP57_469 [uncultured Caudovirales phage]CAB5208781.1 hypothetical protein UFOVP181_170 [uncultured Caudovirales phage]